MEHPIFDSLSVAGLSRNPQMSSLRGLQPTAGLIICLGVGYAAVFIGYPSSDVRQHISSKAAETRRQVLLTALSKRLQQSERHTPKYELTSMTDQSVVENDVTTTTPLTSTIPTDSEILLRDGTFFAVTGPDVTLTALARDRIRRVLHLRGSTSIGGVSSVQPLPSRLVVPHDCVFGTGHLSSLVEQQLLSKQAPPPIHDESEQLLQPPTAWRLVDNEAVVEDLWEDDILSSWDRLLLKATRLFMDPDQIDHGVLWALERALFVTSPALRSLPYTPGDDEEMLSTVAYKSSPPSPWIIDRAEVTAVTTEGEIAMAKEKREPPAPPEERSDLENFERESACMGSSSFVLEIVSNASRDPLSLRGGSSRRVGGIKEEKRPPALCGEMVRWAWRLANRGLSNVIVGSPDPWILAELQQALSMKSDALSGASPEGTGGNGGGAIEIVATDRDGGLLGEASELIIVRVALPSAVEREQAVTAVVEELGIDRYLSPLDVSMLADLTGGRRVALLDVLERVRTAPSASVAAHCRVAVDDQALLLADSWELLFHENDPLQAAGGEGVQVQGSSSIDRYISRDDRAALWEALHALGTPAVSVGASPSSLPAPPRGSMPPSELLRACELEPSTLLRLTREGWLEVHPAPPTAGSGIVLRDLEPVPESPPALPPPLGHRGDSPTRQRLRRRLARPPVRVFAARLPVESLSHLRWSFIGANPMQLAAFRRLVDASRPLSKNPGHGDGPFLVGGDTSEIVFAGAEVSNRWGGAHPPKTTLGLDVSRGDDSDGSERRYARGSGLASGAWRASQLERAGCLIEASVLRRQSKREDEKLADDGEALSLRWVELGMVRRDLERNGKGDASEGEWAEVQLELIRQERAVVADAHEMRARRARLEKTRRHIKGLERRAESVSPSIPGQNLPRRTFGETSPLPIVKMGDPEVSSRFAVERRWSTLAEDVILRDADGGVRLMPLRKLPRKRGGSVEGEGVIDGGNVDEVGSGVVIWSQARRWWKWMRGG